MRKRFLLFALALLAGALLYLVLHQQEGYLIFSVGRYVVETTLWGALVVLVLALVALLVLRRLLRLVFWPRRWWHRHNRRQGERSLERTARGMIDYLGGDWPRAVDNLLAARDQSPAPALNYLGAAASCYQMGEHERMQRLLRDAESREVADPLATGLLRVRLLLQEGEFDRALPLVESLHRRSPDHPTVLRLQASTRKGLRDWDGLQAMLADLKRHKAITPEELDNLEVEVHRERLANFAHSVPENRSASEKLGALDQLWDSLPRRLHKHPRLVAVYVDQLRQLNRGDKAEQRLRRFLNSHWDPELVALYGAIEGDDGARQLAAAEGWLEEHPESPELLRALGDLCARQQLWGKAREYFERALRLQPDPRTWLALGELHRVLEDAEASSEAYREGLRQAVERAR